MSPAAETSPPPVAAEELSRDPIARAVRIGRVSGGSMLALGGASALGTILHPLTVAFLISMLVVGNGWIEWRWSGRLRARDVRAPRALMLNQIALGAELVGYAAWQYFAIGPAAIQALLARPLVSTFLGVLSPDEVRILVELIEPMVRLLYACVAVVAVAGCGGLAWYYRSRRRLLSPSFPTSPSRP